MSVADDHALTRPGAAAGGTDRTPGTRDMAGLPRWIWPAGYAVAGVLLFLCYLRISATVTVTADGGHNAMQAWDMLHGNWLLRGWTLGDASYYTTELPEYALVEVFRGLGPQDVRVCAAITYTLLVVLAGLLAKGDRTGKEGLIRVAIAAGMMIAPQVPAGAVELLTAPDHTGTGVPLLLTFIVLDRAPRRGWVPAAVGLMLVLGQIADQTVLTMGVLPIVVVYGARVYRDVVQRRESATAHWFDMALIVSAVVSVAAARAIVKIIGSLGGWKVLPVNSALAPSASWPGHIAMVADGVLRLYGASFNAGPVGFATVLAVIHLVGVALAAWAICRVFRRFFACDDMIAKILATAIVIQLIAYAVSTLPYNSLESHEIASVLPFGAALAGRVLAGRLTQARLLPALALVACGYLVALGYGVRQPAVPAHDEALTGWLRAHHFTAGLGSYAVGGSVDLASHGTITMAVPWLRPDFASRGNLFEESAAEFDPRLHYANFVVITAQDGPTFALPPSWIIRVFGRPAHTYHYQAWTIMTWNKNLLDDIRLLPPPPALPARQVVPRGRYQPGQRPRQHAGGRRSPSRESERQRADREGDDHAQRQHARPSPTHAAHRAAAHPAATEPTRCVATTSATPAARTDVR
jgi:hypothetical protein